MQFNELVCANGGVSTDFRAKLDKMTFVGIDFGTSTTTVTRLVYNQDEKRLESQPLEISQEDAVGVKCESHLVPTVIAMVGKGHLIYGEGAKACLLGDENFAEGYNVWSEFKMRLGEKACYPKSQMSKLKSPVPGTTIEEPKDAARLFFAYLKNAIDEAVRKSGLPEDVQYAVTVPASFAPNQRKELCEAIRAAGIDLKPTALLDEPNSAFLGAIAGYAEIGASEQFFQEGRDSHVLVFDFGAGTCDISLLKVGIDRKIANLAISHFTALGGRNIDAMISNDILYPKLTADRKSSELPVQLIAKNILNKLRPVAEQLKIAMCDNFESAMGERAFAMVDNDPDFSVEARFKCETRDFGTLDNQALELTAGEFVKIMNEFSEDPRTAFENGHKSIFDPIQDVLKKANFGKSDIDFVLMVGGSSLNPFIKEKIEEFFPGVEVLDDIDPRTLVSRGAAFHSFSINVFGESFILPITSEDIYVKARNGKVKVVPAGTVVPTGQYEVPGLYINDETATNGRFGIPLYASNGDREIGVAVFELLDIGRGCDVKFLCSITGDKTVECEIEAAGKNFKHRFDMPASSEDLSPEVLEFTRAVNELDYTAIVNRGIPTVEQYERVAKVCMKIGKEVKAADYYRDLMYEHRNEHYEHKIAEAYREAKCYGDALEWMRRAVEYRRSYINVWYMIWDSQRVGGWESPETQKWLSYGLETWDDDLDLKYVKMRSLDDTGNKDMAEIIARELCDAWEKMGVEGLHQFSLDRFERVARKLGKQELVQKCREQLKLLGNGQPQQTMGTDFTLVSSRTLDGEKEGGC